MSKFVGIFLHKTLDTAFAEKGSEFHNLPDLYAVFISEIDPFGEHHAAYHVKRSLAETETTVYNGINEIYVNTAAKDGTLIADLMQYFENSNGINPKFEKLSYRVEQFKNDETEVTTMASVFDEYAQEVAEKVSQERMAEQAKEAVLRMLKEGASIEFIAKIFPSFSMDEIKKLEQNELVNA